MTGIDRLLDIARGAVGLTSEDEAFQALCGPGEEPARARELARLSACALFLRGCLARAIFETWTDGSWGMPIPGRLWAPYVTGQAMADLVAVCHGRPVPLSVNMRLVRRELGRIFPGALVIVGAAGREHVYLVESIERDGWPDGSIELTAIEAGQVDGQGRQCVRRRVHEIDANGLDLVIGIGVEGRMDPVREEPRRRPVSWVLDPRALLGDA